jgi:CBS domain-containing protein
MALGKTVSDIMTRHVITLLEEDNLERVSADFGHLHFRHLPVVDDGKLVGILSQHDLMKATLRAEGKPADLARTARFLEQTFVRDLMRTDVLTARPDEAVGQAARRMLETEYGALPVVDADGMLVGIVTENDIVRVASDVL